MRKVLIQTFSFKIWVGVAEVSVSLLFFNVKFTNWWFTFMMKYIFLQPDELSEGQCSTFCLERLQQCTATHYCSSASLRGQRSVTASGTAANIVDSEILYREEDKGMRNNQTAGVVDSCVLFCFSSLKLRK